MTHVTLRRKPLKNDRESLYLDFYPPITDPATGKETRRHFLGLHVFKAPKNPLDREHNKDTMMRAELIRQRKQNELNRPEIYSDHEREQLRVKGLLSQSFTEYFRKLVDRRAGATRHTWSHVLRHLEQYHKGDIRFSDLTEPFCNGFRDHLFTVDTPWVKNETGRLSQNSVLVYFSKFKTAIRQAHKDGLIQIDLAGRIDSVKKEETVRTALSQDEVNALIRTECTSQILKRAAIFSTYTGLRFSDIHKLKWIEIEEQTPGEFVVHFRQKKTRGVDVLPIPKEALALLGERGAPGDLVFDGLKYSTHYNKILAKWVGLAGITKNVTFHVFRHTFATQHVLAGTDIFTLSKLLGHKDPRTTLVYAKMADEMKRVAANRITFDIGSWK